MLIQFTVSNFLSFKNEVSLNMAPAKSRSMKNHIITDVNNKKVNVLPIGAIYGANASGKTNLINAIACSRNLIINGTRGDSSTEITPFLLDSKTEIQPSRFEFIFKHDGIVYTYGFVASSSRIHEEWLFAYYSKQESLIFERMTEENGKTVFEPGNRFVSEVGGKKPLGYIAEFIRPNQLFLTEAAVEKNVEFLKPVIHWFRDHLTIIRPNSKYKFLTLKAHRDHNFINYLSDFLKVAGTGVDQIECESEEFDPNKHLTEFPEDFRNDILSNLQNKKTEQLLIRGPKMSATICIEENRPAQFLSLKMLHKRSDGTSVLFDPSDESDGTRRLMDLAPALQDIWQRDQVYIIDEIDRSLHTHIAKLFIETCLKGVVEKGARGQIIMTTHDTNLLDRNMLRKDEIWLMEKDRSGSSHLSSLAEYKVSDGLNYENGYLNGRFGAIPYIGDLDLLMKN
jgi:AAA15 family ATPase/GTPase